MPLSKMSRALHEKRIILITIVFNYCVDLNRILHINQFGKIIQPEKKPHKHNILPFQPPS